uniref:Secreted protein n=1 Tax=Caenorhabditis tropicalis TaxID=1561998 RepID=A0A1I7T241_9PELO
MALQIAAFLISLTVFCHAEVPETSHPISDQIYGKYIELSMNLTILLKDTAIEEAKIHQVCEEKELVEMEMTSLMSCSACQRHCFE